VKGITTGAMLAPWTTRARHMEPVAGVDLPKIFLTMS